MLDLNTLLIWAEQVTLNPDAPLTVPLSIVWKVAASLFTAIAGGVYVFLKWFWKQHQKDMDGIDARGNDRLDAIKSELNVHAELDDSRLEELKDIVETNRKEMRTGIIDLHKKVEATDERAQERHTDLMGILLEMRNK